MSEIRTERISDAVTLNTFTDTRFKTMKVSVNFLVPLSKESAAKNAILPALVSRATREYPNYTALSRRLAQLYGASINSGVTKVGEYQVLSLSAGGISSRYAFGREDMFSELTQLLFSVIFNPLRQDDGLFPQDGFLQEKRQLIEMKDSEYNDKVTYAKLRCEELLFEGQNAGINRCGSREDVEALTLSGLTDAWQELLSNARIEVFALGDCRPDSTLLASKFSNLGRARNLGPVPYIEPKSVKRVTEEQPVTQSKLSMAFRADVDAEHRLLFQLMGVVLGGTPSSKLFQNVREKLGLCYYCSSAFQWASGTMYINSGVETGNLEKTETAVLQQLQELQNGNVTNDELLYAKLALCNSLNAVGDSLPAVENWYLSRSFDVGKQTPREAVSQLMSYTVEDVVKASQKLRTAMVYSLKGSDSK